MAATLYTFAALGGATFRPIFGALNQFDMQVGQGVDPSQWSVVAIDYPGAHMPWDGIGLDVFNPTYTLLSGCQEGAANAVAAITATPGPFAFSAYSLGSVVAALVYQEIVSGSLTGRASDFIGAVTFGSSVREQGHTIPGGTDPGGMGCFGPTYCMTSTPTSWWDFVNQDPLDPYATVDDTTLAGQDFIQVADAVLTSSELTDFASVVTILQSILPSLFAQIPAIWQDLTEVVFPFLSPYDNSNGHSNYAQPYLGLAGNSLSAVALAINYLNNLAATAVIPPGWPTIKVRYPSTPITPAGAYYVLHDKTPVMRLRSHDDTALFDVYGGTALYDHTAPESVQVIDMKGLIPPWQKISQKGATQDGETFISSLYDPIEGNLTVRIRGRDARYTRRVGRDWIAAWDAIAPSELSWFSHDMGRWWAKVRWAKDPDDKLTGGNQLPQTFQWPFIVYDAFWRSYDCVDSFAFQSTIGWDNFDYVTTNGLTGWTIHYSATPAGGWIYGSNTLELFGLPISVPTGGGLAQWENDPDHTIASGGVDAVAINNTFTSGTDDQVVSITLGTLPGWLFAQEGYDDIWLRTPPPATTPGTAGIRLRIGWGVATLSYFIGGAETVLRSTFLLIPPLPGETWTVICSGRSWTVQRGTSIGMSTVMTVVESGTNSLMGSGYRSAGFGMHATEDAAPAALLSWRAGDNTIETQSGFVNLVNAGDQPMRWRATIYGPGTFNLGDGPNASESVTVGPVLANQVLQIDTDPNKRTITDITSQVNSSQDLNTFQSDLESFLSLALGNNTNALAQAIESVFGITPPQGNVWTLINGGFSDAAAIPPRPVGGPMQSYEIPVSIEGGNASSKIVAAGTPLRRFPY